MKYIEALYIYLTEFIINLANLLELSYYEINALLFCFLYPLAVLGLSIYIFFLKKKLSMLKRKQE